MESTTRDGCLRCGHSELQPGYLDDSADRGTYSQWFEGPLEVGWSGGVKGWRDRNRYRVVARRCAQCGHLDLSAVDPV